MVNSNPSPGTRFQPGQSGNPSGRPKGALGLNARLRRILLERTDPSGKPLADILSEKLIAEALKNPAKMWPFLKDLIERDEGKVLEKVEVSGNPRTLVDMLKALEELEKPVEEIESPSRN